MPHEPIPQVEALHAQRLRWAWIVWGVIVLIVAGRTVIWLRSNNCVQTYFEAGRNWYEGVELYQRLNDTCRYSPFVHALLVPFSYIPERLASVLWRLLGAAVFLTGLAWWVRVVWGKLDGTHKAALLFLTMPLAIGSFNNGQSNVLMMGGILLGIAASARNRWWLAAFGITLACLLKLYPVSLGLLLIVTMPMAFAWRFGLLLAVGMGLPFLLQDPSYVARQYPRWLFNLVNDDRSAWALENGYRDLWALCRAAKLPIDRSAYMFVQLAFAGLAALCCLRMRLRHVAPTELLNRTLALGCCWMALCGPATESSTYILLAPTLASCLLEVWLRRVGRGVAACFVLGSAFLLLGAFVVIFPFGIRVQGYGPQPFGALLLMLGLTAQAWLPMRSRVESTGPMLAPPLLALPGKAA